MKKVFFLFSFLGLAVLPLKAQEVTFSGYANWTLSANDSLHFSSRWNVVGVSVAKEAGQESWSFLPDALRGVAEIDFMTKSVSSLHMRYEWMARDSITATTLVVGRSLSPAAFTYPAPAGLVKYDWSYPLKLHSIYANGVALWHEREVFTLRGALYLYQEDTFVSASLSWKRGVSLAYQSDSGMDVHFHRSFLGGAIEPHVRVGKRLWGDGPEESLYSIWLMSSPAERLSFYVQYDGGTERDERWMGGASYELAQDWFIQVHYVHDGARVGFNGELPRGTLHLEFKYAF